jgi:hypothetical protein
MCSKQRTSSFTECQLKGGFVVDVSDFHRTRYCSSWILILARSTGHTGWRSTNAVFRAIRDHRVHLETT